MNKSLRSWLIGTMLISSLSGCEQIDTGNVGIESMWGQVKETTLPPGVYATVLKSVIEVTAKEVPVELNDLKPKTADNVTMSDVDITVYYKIDPSAAAKLFVKYAGDMSYYAQVGYALGSGLIKRMSREATYKAIAKLQSSDAHTKRTEIAAEIMSTLQAEVDRDAGKNMLVITNVIVRNLVTDPGLEVSIKEAAKVEFEVRQKKQQLLLAEAEAKRLLVEAEGQAKANKVIAESLSSSLVELRRIEMMHNFAGKGTHTVILPNNATPLIQIK